MNDGRVPHTPNGRVSDLTVLVTGASSGIGRAVADGFAARGARVFYLGKDERATRAAADAGNGTAIVCDLTDAESLRSVCAELEGAVDSLDVLVNNAGVEIPAAVSTLTEEIVRSTFAVNFEAPVQLTRLMLPLLSRSPAPSVLNITSIHDRVPSHSNSAYAASKAALRMFTETLAVELGPLGIRVNAIAPGAIATEINRDIIAKVGADAFAELIPLGRVGQVADIVGPALFLSGPEASYVSGATLVVDGAYSHHLVRYRGLH